MPLAKHILLLSFILLQLTYAAAAEQSVKFHFQTLSVDLPKEWLPHADAKLIPANPLYSKKSASHLKSYPLWQLKPAYSNMPENIRVNFGKLPRYSDKKHWFTPEIMTHFTDSYARILDPGHKPSANFLAIFELIKKLSAKQLNYRSGTPLPFIPFLDASQHVTTGFKPLPFANGKGFRFVTAYSIEASILSESTLVYIFQGISNDGKTYVVATFPVTLEGLPKKGERKHLGFSEQGDFVFKANTYNQKASEWLIKNADKITPSLKKLDAIMSSIKADTAPLTQ